MIGEDFLRFRRTVAEVGAVVVSVKLDETDVVCGESGNGGVQRLDTKPPVAPGESEVFLDGGGLGFEEFRELLADLLVFEFERLEFHRGIF